MTKLVTWPLPALLLISLPALASAGWGPLWPSHSCSCDSGGGPYPQPTAVWYGWGGSIGQMAPVPPPPPVIGHGHPAAVWYGWGGSVGMMGPIHSHQPAPVIIPHGNRSAGRE
jgi:hypothetical protein